MKRTVDATPTQESQESARREILRRDLAEVLERRTGGDGLTLTALPVLKLYRFSAPSELAPVIQEPAVYVVVQGRKEVFLGGTSYVYDRAQYLTVAMELPVVSRVLEASRAEPYLCMTLAMDARELAALLVETGRAMPLEQRDARPLYVTPIQASFLDAFLRLVRLLDAPEEIPVIAPLVIREIHFRLLQGEQFGSLASIAVGDGRMRRVAKAIAWIKEHFAEPMRIEALASQVHMSPSALHQHFKAATAMSPIQYQKRLRLETARQRLLSGATSAEAVAYDVGYASASQFSREYARLFGQPPRRDADLVRQAAQSGGRTGSARGR